MEPFITTFTGRRVNPLNLRVEDISIDDINHHLALINRFVGATREPVNVNQHSFFVSKLLDGTGFEREGLFHDAPEAYLGDVSKWVKQMDCMAGYREAEERAWQVICKALDLNPEPNERLVEADRLMVRFEASMLAHAESHIFTVPKYHRPTVEEIEKVGPWVPWDWKTSKIIFSCRVADLGYYA